VAHDLYCARRSERFSSWELWLSGRVRRYHTHVANPQQNLAEHQWGVAAILLRINPRCSRTLLIHALTHDVGEVRVGDLPAPVKWNNPDIAEAHNDLENDELQQALGWQDDGLTQEEQDWLKAADLLELVTFAHYEMERGNRLMQDVLRNGRDRIISLMWTWHKDVAAATTRFLRELDLLP
jgi:5'-deoxynucleotidase YfbR-like HD superfamily hydrolase